MSAFKLKTALLTGMLLLGLSAIPHAASRQEIKSALKSARRDLRISIAIEKRIASDLEILKKSGNSTPDVIEDYELYLRRVQAMVAENRKIVAKIEALNARYDAGKTTEGAEVKDDTAPMVNPAIPEEQVVDEVSALDRQLDSSLAEFDEMLLKELDLIRAKSAEKMRDLAQEAAAVTKRLRDKGIDITTSYDEESLDPEQRPAEQQKDAETEKDASETEKENKAEKGKDDGGLAAQDKSSEGTEGAKSHPKNRYDPKDDDIVARQLREAAEKETDPELREKLWKEYEHYKSNTNSTTSNER
jgi:hypothetical protein